MIRTPTASLYAPLNGSSRRMRKACPRELFLSALILAIAPLYAGHVSAQIFTPNRFTVLDSNMPNVTLMRIDGSRHFVMLDQPAALDAAVEPFLK